MLLAVALAAALHASAADSVPGTWKITGDVMGNPLDQLCTLKQADTTVTGSCTGNQGEALPVTGAFKDGKLTFKYPSDYQGTALTIVFSATFAAPQQLKGSVEVQPMGVTGTFTAAPAPAKP